jgi:hypothetical protein
LGELRFPTGVADVSNALPPGTGAIDQAVDLVLAYPGAHNGGRFRTIRIVGEASPPWRNPRPGVTPAEENDALSVKRAESVANAIGERMPGTTKEVIGIGSREALNAGMPADQPAPERQRASMTGIAQVPATPGTPGTPGTAGTPGTPGSSGVAVPPTKLTAPIPGGQIPNPLAAGEQSWGWDTSAGVSVGVGAGFSAAGYAGVTTGYSIPLPPKHHVGPFTMKLIRIAVGLYKIVGDVLTGSPLGFIRDATALGVFGIEEILGRKITEAVINWAIPAPAGAS